ncbi:VOC family protein [Rubrivirga sp.]|uniref:VOC family protein n=1 Tax=Rubrivirga sp. TaxID=1885344 RepID=UPI003B52AEFE
MPARLGHLRLDVADLDRQTAFYTGALGLTVRERATDGTSHYAFLTDAQPVPGGAADGMHHRLVLRQAREPAPAQAGGSAPDRSGPLDHFAWEVDDEAELLATVERLRAMGVETDLQEAQIAWQCYFHDPEGTRLEVYCDRRARPDGARLWRGQQEGLAEERLRHVAG